jgi:hypothetical protein
MECTLLVVWLNETRVAGALDIKDQLGRAGKRLQCILMGHCIEVIIRGAKGFIKPSLE